MKLVNKFPYKAIVDADYILYAAGMVGQYTLKHVYADAACTTLIQTFRYVKDCKEFCINHALESVDPIYIEEEDVLEPIENTLHTVKCMIKDLEDKFEGGVELYLTGSGNYREDIACEVPYKGNRWSKEQRANARAKGEWLDWLDATEVKYKEVPRPKHKQAIIDYMVKYHGAEIVNGMEADDKVSIIQTAEAMKTTYPALPSRTCIVHVDKDIDMVPGHHYNPTKKELYYVSALGGYKNFAKQLLTGDTSDNIPGLRGIGPTKASKLIDDLLSIKDIDDIVRSTYAMHKDFEGYSTDAIDKIIANRGALLWMLTEEPSKEGNL